MEKIGKIGEKSELIRKMKKLNKKHYKKWNFKHLTSSYIIRIVEIVLLIIFSSMIVCNLDHEPTSPDPNSSDRETEIKIKIEPKDLLSSIPLPNIPNDSVTADDPPEPQDVNEDILVNALGCFLNIDELRESLMKQIIGISQYTYDNEHWLPGEMRDILNLISNVYDSSSILKAKEILTNENNTLLEAYDAICKLYHECKDDSDEKNDYEVIKQLLQLYIKTTVIEHPDLILDEVKEKVQNDELDYQVFQPYIVDK